MEIPSGQSTKWLSIPIIATSMLVGVKFKNRFEDQPLWMRKFNGKSPLSGAGKHPDFQVTSCFHFVTTNVKIDE